MSPFWRNFNHCLHWKLSFWQLPVQPVMKISSKWRHFRFSVLAQRWIHTCQVTNLCSKIKWPLYYQTMENSLRNKCVLYSCLYISQSDITLRCLFHQRGCDTHGYMLFSIVELAKDTPHLALVVKLKYTTLSHHGRVMSILNVTKTSSVFSVSYTYMYYAYMALRLYTYMHHVCIGETEPRDIESALYGCFTPTNIVQPLYSTIIFLQNRVWSLSSQKTPHTLFLRARYGVPFTSVLSDLYPTLSIVISYVASCYDTPWFQEVRTYILKHPYNTARYNSVNTTRLRQV